MLDSEEEAIKVILLGESGVGKTNLISITNGGNFNENEVVTSALSFCVKKLNVNGKEYTINLWDTVGQEKLRNLTKLFYNDTKIVIFVYDITRKKTFEEIKNYWVNDIEEKLGKDIIIGVVGNKMDLFLDEEISKEKGEEYAKSIGALFLSSSAKTDKPTHFEGFLARLYEQYLKKNAVNSTKNKNNKKVFLKKKNSNLDNGKKCC